MTSIEELFTVNTGVGSIENGGGTIYQQSGGPPPEHLQSRVHLQSRCYFVYFGAFLTGRFNLFTGYTSMRKMIGTFFNLIQRKWLSPDHIL